MKIGIVDDGVDESHIFLRPDRHVVPARVPEGRAQVDDAEGDRRARIPGPRLGPAADGCRSTARPRSTPRTSRASRRGGRARPHPAGRPSAGGEPLRHRAERLDRELPRLQRPDPRIGYTANTPEIVAAFEAAVRDGMDVINFSGGAAETDPVNDALIEAVSNVAAAGVVPVIAAGNERDDFGLGSIDSPGSAPDAITVAASSNLHVFAPSLSRPGPSAPRPSGTSRSGPRCPSASFRAGRRRTRRSSTSAR